MHLISRRKFLAALLAAGAAGLAAGCGTNSNSIMEPPVQEPEHITVIRPDAAGIAEAEADVVFTDLTGPTLALMDSHQFNSPDWNDAILDYLTTYPGAPGEMALMTYHFGAQNGSSYPEQPAATAMTAQQAANHGVRLLRALRPGETEGWDQIYTICERQDDTGTRHQLWQVIVVRLGQTDPQGNVPELWAWFHIHLDAVTGALVHYHQSASAPDDYPHNRQEQEATMAALQQILDAVLEIAGAGQTAEGLRIDSDNVDSLHLTFCYACDIDGQFYTVSCERDGSLVRLWPAEQS